MMENGAVMDGAASAFAFGCLCLLLGSGHAFHVDPSYRGTLGPSDLIRANARRSSLNAVSIGPTHHISSRLSATATNDQSSKTSTKPKQMCLYKNSATDNQWKQRIELKDLKVGQELQGVVVQRLLQAKTGPKVFIDCGIGRIDGKGDWQMVNGMLRLVNSWKLSVAQKRASRLAKKDAIPVYVSRIYVPSGQLELTLTPPVAQKRKGPLQSTSSLQPGDEVLGVPAQYEPYGIFVRILPNYNRRGLLHIKKVSAALEMYIRQTEGLKKFASNFEDEDGIPLVVVANHKKRGLELDLSDEFKEALAEERKPAAQSTTSSRTAVVDVPDATVASESSTGSTDTSVGDYDEYYAEYAKSGEAEPDEYDEDRDIEDALGLGSY